MEFTAKEPKEVKDTYRVVTYLASEIHPEFMNLIRAPFLEKVRYDNDMMKLIDRDAYYERYPKYINSLLARPDAKINLALSWDEKEQTDVALGWCLFENKTVHFVWVKKDVWRQGICNALLPREFDTITHLTHRGINIWVRKYPEVRFIPWA